MFVTECGECGSRNLIRNGSCCTCLECGAESCLGEFDRQENNIDSHNNEMEVQDERERP